MQRINEDIKSGQLKQIYLLYGEEAYLRKQYRDRLRNALAAEGDTMNYSYFEGKDISVGAVIDLAETLPFFADRTRSGTSGTERSYAEEMDSRHDKERGETDYR